MTSICRRSKDANTKERRQHASQRHKMKPYIHVSGDWTFSCRGPLSLSFLSLSLSLFSSLSLSLSLSFFFSFIPSDCCYRRSIPTIRWLLIALTIAARMTRIYLSGKAPSPLSSLSLSLSLSPSLSLPLSLSLQCFRNSTAFFLFSLLSSQVYYRLGSHPGQGDSVLCACRPSMFMAITPLADRGESHELAQIGFALIVDRSERLPHKGAQVFEILVVFACLRYCAYASQGSSTPRSTRWRSRHGGVHLFFSSPSSRSSNVTAKVWKGFFAIVACNGRNTKNKGKKKQRNLLLQALFVVVIHDVSKKGYCVPFFVCLFVCVIPLNTRLALAELSRNVSVHTDMNHGTKRTLNGSTLCLES